MSLTELGLTSLKVFWWQQSLHFFNKIAATPPGSLIHTVLLDNHHDAFQRGVRKFTRSVFHGLAGVGYDMSRDTATISMLDVPAIMELLLQDLQGGNAFELHCPRAAPSVGVVSCTYHQWFRPYSRRRRSCHLPVSGNCRHRLLQFRLGSHTLPIVTGWFVGGQHVDRASSICSHCGPGSLADELHVLNECPLLQPLRQQYAAYLHLIMRQTL